jgi:phenylacetic acid degradation protein
MATAKRKVRVWSINGVTPVVDPKAFVHPSAVLIGDVMVGAGCYIGPSACLRGDFGRIDVHSGANLQDCCIMHGFPGTDTVVEEEGHVGHGAILHGCIVQKNALVGMNAVVNDNAVIGESAIVAAMAFVKAGMIVPPRTLVAGVPAKVVRALTRQELEWKIEGTASYQELTRRSLATMVEAVALDAPEPDRKRIELPELLPLSTIKAKRRSPG